MSFTTHFKCKQNKKHDFSQNLNAQSKYRHKNDKVWNKDVLGGFLLKINKLGGIFNGTQEYIHTTWNILLVTVKFFLITFEFI